MGLKFKANTTSANAPDVEPGEYVGKFAGVEAKTLPKSQFDPEAFIWAFELLDDDGKVIYGEDGDPLVVEKVTSQNTNVASKTTPGAVKVLKALMTADEFASFEEGTLEMDDSEFIGRKVKLDVIKKENGWPGIEDVRRIVKRASKAAAAAAERE